MEQTEILSRMFLILFDSLHAASREQREHNYERQLASYNSLFEALCSNRDGEMQLICARCLISATRSLAREVHADDSIAAAQQGLLHLRPFFTEPKRMNRSDFYALIEQGINCLAPQQADEVVDAVLFMYLSLKPAVQKTHEGQLN